jgi:polyhydroxyalkanoate synthesis regulator phasin
MLRKNILIVSAGAVLGGLGVGYVTVGPMAHADKTAIIQDDAGTTAADPADNDTAAPDPSAPADAQQPGQRQHNHLTGVLAPLVTDGTITQDQADKVIDAIVAARPDHGPGHGRGGRGTNLRAAKIRAEGLSVAATTIGISEDALRTELRSGSTVAQVATAHTIDPQKVIDALVADATQHIDQAVTDGKLSADQAAKVKSTLVVRITRFVNEGPRHGGPRGTQDGGQPPADQPPADQGSLSSAGGPSPAGRPAPGQRLGHSERRALPHRSGCPGGASIPMSRWGHGADL